MWTLCLFALLTVVASDTERSGCVYYERSSGSYSFKSGVDSAAVACATLVDEISTTGWSYLKVVTNENYDDYVQAFAAGYVESYLTFELIHNHWLNTQSQYCNKPSEYCSKLSDFLDKQEQYIQGELDRCEATDSYWHQIGLALTQLNGIIEGYGNATNGMDGYEISRRGFLLLNIGGDLEDLETALGAPSEESSRVVGGGSCSALIKFLPDMSDVFVGHDTWTDFTTMLRIYKLYNFSFHAFNGGTNDFIPGHQVSFSSYPATIYSGDDFYILSSHLVTIETTIGNSNDKLWHFVQPVGQVLEWLRNIVANRLANTGEEWCKLFARYNSGTYNNEWMIVDYKQFVPGHKVQSDTLWVLEQIPGYVEYHDMSHVLNEKGYWASYNAAAFPDVANMSGIPQLVAKYGDWFTHDKTPRALIFARNQTDITDMTSMYKLMRYNNFKDDPLSRCDCNPPYSSENAISARSDLNPKNGTYQFGALGLRNHGGTDSKITSFSMSKTLSCLAVSGPTHDQQPVFQWSTSPFSNVTHLGMPDRWDFDAVTIHWEG
ncbi:putative phospholipase B-like 2 [Corticium candelabrum]|uniref:putative phospholipase B-like 2 n=1 Tax=Corticium candelabrum TaxID=121492 RepID=UPI002E255991|nr:putative phospholipase B-like 2 [Corticium candelabrum]